MRPSPPKNRCYKGFTHLMVLLLVLCYWPALATSLDRRWPTIFKVQAQKAAQNFDFGPPFRQWKCQKCVNCPIKKSSPRFTSNTIPSISVGPSSFVHTTVATTKKVLAYVQKGQIEKNTVSIGFCDHPPSEGLRSLNPAWSLKQESG